VINCSSISNIDLSAVEMLEELNGELLQLGIQLHLSEVKSPVMDRLNSSRLINMLSGKIFLSHYQAIQTLSPEILNK
jgi:SulP family sulfate permease